MTTTQGLTIAAVAAAAAVMYMPWSKLRVLMKPAAPDSMAQVHAVLRIRDSATTPEVRKACTTLLEALLK